MQWKLIQSDCGATKLNIIQDQGDNTPTIIDFPYDATGVDFSGTVSFPTPVLLSLGNGVEVENIVSCTGSIANNTLTVTAVASGTIFLNMPLNGVGILPNTYVTSFKTGTGGIGTYGVGQSQTTTSTTIVVSRVSMQLTSEQTQDVPEGQYPFDLWTISPSLSPINTDPIKGFFTINPSITRII